MGIEEKKEIAIRQGSTPGAVIEHAIKTGAPIDQLEKLLTLQERYDANEAKKAYNASMAIFKANPPKINKDKTVKYSQVQYKHASLHNVVDKISTELSKHGLSASWITSQNAGITVTCKITHKQGHSEETTLTAQPDTSGSKNAIQAIGSTVTYLERYTLLALTGLATQDQDDDGQATALEECIDDKQHHQIMDFIAEKNLDTEKFCKAFGIPDIPKLPKSRFAQAIDSLTKAKSKA